MCGGCVGGEVRGGGLLRGGEERRGEERTGWDGKERSLHVSFLFFSFFFKKKYPCMYPILSYPPHDDLPTRSYGVLASASFPSFQLGWDGMGWDGLDAL